MTEDVPRVCRLGLCVLKAMQYQRKVGRTFFRDGGGKRLTENKEIAKLYVLAQILVKEVR